MKKFFLFLLLALTAGALIFYYFIREQEGPFDPWKLVPYQSAVVVESNYPLKSWQQFLDSKFGEGYKKTALYENTTSFFNLIDSLSETPGASEKLLSGSMIISAIPTAQDQIQLLYIMDADAPEKQKILHKAIASVENTNKLKSASRKYQDQTIYEISDQGNRNFAFIFYKDHLIASKSAFLIEMVIRQANNDYKNNFKLQNQELFRLPLLANDAGNIYINMSRLGRGLEVFVNQDTKSFFNPLSKINGGAALDLSFSQKALIMNGFSISYDSADLLNDGSRSPDELRVINYVPNSTQFIWSGKVNRDMIADENENVGRWIGSNISYLQLPSLRNSEASEVLFIDTRDPGEALNFFNQQAELSAKEDTVYREYYAEYPLTEIAGQQWPEACFPNLYKPYRQTFFTMINNYIVMANNLEALKIIIEDFENENTWGKNLELREFFSIGLEESNLSLIVHPDNFWEQMLSKLNDPWEEKFEANERFLKGVVVNNLQLSRMDEKYYTSLVMGYEPQEVLSKEGRSMNVRFTASFASPVAVRPFIVKNHYNNQFEILAQDEAKNLALLDWDGNVLWTDSIAEVIENDVVQIDFYNNEKLQYFFTGRNKLFIIDRNGEHVEDYPLTIGRNPIQYSAVVDYDNSKNYRFLLADTQGSLYMVDKHGNILDGWTPKKLQGELSSQPFHVRVRAKDYIVAIQQRGIVHVMNRRGEYYPGFPIELKNRIDSDIFLEKGTDAESTFLTMVTTSGQLVKINLDGIVVSKENLYRPVKESRFYIVPEVQGKGYIIVRQGLNQMAILNEDGSRRFEKDYLTTESMNVHYYNFGAGKEIISLTDEEQQFTYLYNEDGNLINNQPINSGKAVAILYFKGTKEFHIFKVYNNTVSALTF